MESLYKSLTGDSKDERARALEVLDNLLKGRFRSMILNFLEPKEGKPASLSAREQSLYLEDLAHYPSEWVIAGSIHVIGKNKVEACLKPVAGALDNPSPVVREAALDAVIKVDHPGQISESIKKMMDDPDPGIRRLAIKLFEESE